MSKDSIVFDRVVEGALLLALIGVSLVIFPFFGLNFGVTKSFWIFALLAIAFVSWVVARLRDRTVKIPTNYVFPGLLVLVISAFISALVSGTPALSLVGLGYEPYTVLALALFTLLSFLVSTYLQSKKKATALMFGFLVTSLVVFVFQVIRILLPFLFRGSISFSDSWVNLIGKWNEFGIFFGFTVLLALLMIEVLKVKSTFARRISFLALGAGLIVLVIVNYWILWAVLAAVALALFVYLLILGNRISVAPVEGPEYPSRENPTRPAFFNPILIVLLISLFFVFLGRPGSFVSNTVNNLNSRLAINVLEVRPSLQGTWSVASQSLKDSPVFGTGPNRFAFEWIKFKPVEVNTTEFWAIDFQTGVGFFPTLALTLGGLGILITIALLGLVLWQVIRAVFARGVSDPESYAFLLVGALSVLYWWLFAVIYPLEIVGLTLAFGSLGLLIAALNNAGLDRTRKINLAIDPKVNFASLVVLIVLLLVGVGGFYSVAEKYWSVMSFQRSAYALSVGSLDKAETLITSAVRMNANETFLRQLAMVKMLRMDQIAGDKTLDQDQASTKFQTAYSQGFQALTLAEQENPTNYLNKVLRGRILEKLVPLKVEGAYAASAKAYQEAAILNPTNPGIFLDLARLEITNGNLTKAKEFINQAIVKKPNYIAAISLLSQIEADQGNLGRAIEQANQAVTLAPNDEGARFQLGFLLYQRGSYSEAIQALTDALRLNPNFANAKYFLGMSYRQSGEKDKALALFEELSRLNPDNQELKDVLSELRAPVKTPKKN